MVGEGDLSAYLPQMSLISGRATLQDLHTDAVTQGDSRQALTFINWLHGNVVHAAHTRASCHLRSESSTPSDSKDQSSDI